MTKKQLVYANHYEGTNDSGTILLIGSNRTLENKITEILKQYIIVQMSICDPAGEDAMEKVRIHRPGVIICNLEKDGEKHLRFLRVLKSDSQLKFIPVILVTSKTSTKMKIKGLEAGADDVIQKPFSERILQLRVKNLLKMHNQEIALLRLNKQLEQKVVEQLQVIAKNVRLTKFFPEKLLKWILSSERDVELSGEKMKLTIFFSDLAGFTELAENTPPEEVRNLLSEYFTEMVKIVDRYEGTLDKFIGDGLMVFFGAPYPMEEKDQAILAVSMAVAMQIKMEELSRKWRKEGIKHSIRIRMGIHQDYVMVGNFGSRQVLEYTVFGSGVNLASRLESYCEPQKILVSLPVYSYTNDLFPFSDVREQIFRGFERLVPVSELDPAKMDETQLEKFCE